MAEEREVSTTTYRSTDLRGGGDPVADDGPRDAGTTGSPAPAAGSSVAARLVQYFVARYRNFLHQQRVRQFEKALGAAPDSITTLANYANYLESAGLRDDAAALHARLVSLCRRQREADHAAVYCRKLDGAKSPEAARCYREMATLYSELNRFDDAARAARRVVELYLSEGQPKAAAGYIRQLPALGPKADATRNELTRLLEAGPQPTIPTVRSDARVDPSPERRSADPLPPASYTTKPLPPVPSRNEEDVFLTGHLGRITPFDVVQIIESNALTGRLDFISAPGSGAIFFQEGHIVAAICGGKRRYDALRELFTAEPGPFKVVVTDVIPPDEFEARHNTGLVLDVLRDIDEANENRAAVLVRPGEDDFFS